MQRGTWLVVVGMLCLGWSSLASAQLKPKALRFGIEIDAFSAGGVYVKPDGASESSVTKVVSFGADALGNARAIHAHAPVGITGDLVLHPKWMLGLRGGFGFDHYRPDGAPKINVFTMTFTPSATFVPTGNDRIKPFLRAGPVLQFTQLKAAGSGREHAFFGGFSLGGGSFFFMSDRSSVDVGAYFEGRFGQLEGVGDTSYAVRDLRGVIRFSVSIWNYRADRPVMRPLENGR